MNRMTAFVVFSLIFEICNGETDLFELSVIHMNSFHARFDEINPVGSTCHPGDECIGGLARVAAAAKRIKKETENSIFLNAGNNYEGTIWYNYHKWTVVSFFTNMLQHDAMSIGSYEFVGGIDGLVPFLKDVQAPVVSTNIDDTDEPDFQGLTNKSTIIVRNGRKIGVIGVSATMGLVKNSGKLKFLDTVQTINRETDELKKNHDVNIIVVLSDSGAEGDERIAVECPDVDLIVKGNMRHFYHAGKKIDARYPFVTNRTFRGEITQSEGPPFDRIVLSVHAGAYTQYLGHISVRFDQEGRIIDWIRKTILLDRNIIPDPQIIEALKPWRNEVEGLGNFVIGITRRRLANSNYWLECSLANLITDAMVESWVDRRQSPAHWTYAAVSFIMPSYMWFSIGRHDVTDYNITLGDLIEAIPSTGTWDVVEIYGRNIIQMLEFSVAEIKLHGKFKQRFLHWSGLKAEFDLKKPPYQRLIRAKIRCQNCEVPRFEDISYNQHYRVIVDSFYLRNIKQQLIGQPYVHRTVGKTNHRCLIDFIRRHSPIDYDIEGRVNIL